MKGYWILIAVLLIVIGIGIFTAVMTANKWDFSKLSTDKLETASYVMNMDFENISVITDTADVTLAMAEDDVCRIVCHEYSKLKHFAVVEEQTLKISVNDKRSWYDRIELFLATPSITVYLPNAEYADVLVRERTGNVKITDGFNFGNVDISTTTGNILVEGVTCGSLSLFVSTGKTEVNSVDCTGEVKIGVSTGQTTFEDVKCKSLSSNGTTGDLVMRKLTAAEKISVKRRTGDVILDCCDAYEISIKTTTGKVVGSLLSEKTFFARTNTGEINMPKNTSGGRCEITTDTGDIKIEIKD